MEEAELRSTYILAALLYAIRFISKTELLAIYYIFIYIVLLKSVCIHNNLIFCSPHSINYI